MEFFFYCLIVALVIIYIMKYYLHRIVVFIVVCTSMYTPSLGQTKAAKKEIQRETEVSFLRQKSLESQKLYHVAKTKALRRAKRKSWKVRWSTPKGGIKELQRIGENGKPLYYQTHNYDAAISLQTNRLWSGGDLGFDINGEDMILGEWDGGGVLINHQELTGRVEQRDEDTEPGDHATHVAGTLIASGVKEQAKGMASQANLWAHDWNSAESEMSQEAVNGLLVSNHSYGNVVGWSNDDFGKGEGWYWWGTPSISEQEDANFGSYTQEAADWDEIAILAPFYLIVKSVGNDRGEGPAAGTEHYVWDSDGWVTSTQERLKDGGTKGYDCLTPKAVAKNILSVGAVGDVKSPYDPGSISMTSFSDWGPTDDGRIKPDICGNGSGLYSCISSGVADYGYKSGTSMSGPNVAGSLILLQQYYHTLYNEYMKSSTLKALVINTAFEAGPDNGPDYMFGWGVMNSAKAASAISSKGGQGEIIEGELTNGGAEVKYTFKSTGSEPIYATLVWTDPAGVAANNSLDDPSIRLVNDLDLQIKRADQSWGPWVLDPANPEAAATRGDNIRDNVEQVVISEPSQGEYEFVVSAKNIEGDSQQYSLVVSGISSVGKDIAVKSIEVQVEVCEFSVATPVNIGVQNVGLTDQQDVILYYQLYDEQDNELVSENKTIASIASGATENVQVTIPMNVGKSQYRLVASVEEDENNGNNRQEKIFKTQKTDLTSGNEVLIQGFENDWVDEGWSVFNANGDQFVWENYSNDFQHSGGKFLLLFPNGGAADDWVFSNCVQLNQGDTYRLQFYHTNFQQNEVLHVYIGQTAQVSGMTTLLREVQVSGGWNKESIDIQVAQDGVYYVGWHAINSNSYAVGIDDIRIENNRESIPEAKFEVSSESVIAGENVDFSDVSLGVPTSWQWTFEGGDPSQASQRNVRVKYSQSGTYDVGLSVSNTSGENSITNTDFITVSKQEIFMGEKDRVVYDAYYRDPQGTSDYDANIDMIQTLTPGTTEKALRVEFLEFSLVGDAADSGDWLKVYDGADEMAPLIGVFQGTSLPEQFVSSNKTGALTFVFHSDETSQSSGWKALVQETDPLLGANFAANYTQLVKGQSVNFSDFSSGEPSSWSWTFEGGTPSSSSQQNPQGIRYDAVGVYPVVLTVKNTNGEDTYTRDEYIRVDEPVFAPVVSFNAELNEQGSSVSMSWIPQGVPSTIEEGFEDAWLPLGWEIKRSTSISDINLQDVSDDKTWFYVDGDSFSNSGDSYIHEGIHSAGINWNSPDFNWLITPNVVLSPQSVLRFWMWYNNADYEGEEHITKFHILIREDNNWKILKSYGSADQQNIYKSQIELPLNEYSQKMVRLAFVYENNNGWQFALDDIFVGPASQQNSSLSVNNALQISTQQVRELSLSDQSQAKSVSLQTNPIELVGYSIYRNGAKLNQIDDIGILNYVDAPEEFGTYTYCITSLYNNPTGESDKSQEYTFPVIFTGVDDQVVSIYPNPTAGMLHVEFKEGNVQSMELISSSGAKIRVIRVNNQDRELEMDFSSVAPGVYFLRLLSTEGVSVHKLIVQ